MDSDEKSKISFKNFKKLTEAEPFHDRRPWATKTPEPEKPIFENKNPGISKIKYIFYLLSLLTFFGSIYWCYGVISWIKLTFIEPLYNVIIFLVTVFVATYGSIIYFLYLAKIVDIKYRLRLYRNKISFFTIDNRKLRLNIDDIESIKYYPLIGKIAYISIINYYGDRFFVPVYKYKIFLEHLKNNNNLRSETIIKKSFLLIAFCALALGTTLFAYLNKTNATVIFYSFLGILFSYCLLFFLSLFLKFFSKKNIVSRRTEVLSVLTVFSFLVLPIYSLSLSPSDRQFQLDLNKIIFFAKLNNHQEMSSACSQLKQHFTGIKIPAKKLAMVGKNCPVGAANLSSQAPSYPANKQTK